MVAPPSASPVSADRLLRSTTNPATFSPRPNGVPATTASPPRAESGEPHPGWNKAIAANDTKGSAATTRPIRPNRFIAAALGTDTVPALSSIISVRL